MTDDLTLISKAERGKILARAEAEALMEEILSGRVETPEIVRLLLALNERAIAAEELSAFAVVMRRHAAPVFAPGTQRPSNMIDTCGTGGNGKRTFNISTATAFAAAAAGARVAKHGNRSATSLSGSADVLEALGVNLDLPLQHFGSAIGQLGIGFLFARTAHSAARHAAPARQQIAKPTVFNLLGPLTNPAAAEFQVLGVFDPKFLDLVATTLADLGVRRAFVVHGAGGLDEISPAGETLVAEVRDGSVRRFVVTPEDFGMPRAPLSALHGGTPQQNAALIRAVFDGETGPRRDVVAMNAAAALVVTGIATDFHDGAELASRAISSGAAREKLDQFLHFCRAQK